FERTDFQRIRQFSGFIGKIQHNFLWDFFPATRRLLTHYNIELDVFAEYRSVQLSPELRSQKQSEKIRRFLAYLSDYLVKYPSYRVLASVIRYEQAIWELRQQTDSKVSPPARTADDLAALPWPR